MRGFAAIGLDRPKNTANLGGVLRAAGVYGASMVAVAGDRMGRFATDTMKAYKHMPCINVDNVLDAVPFGAIPIVVELTDKSRSLFTFTHPEQAYYIFGPEDGNVRKEVIERVPLVIQIPGNGCMNLAACVNVVLYDRAQKRHQA